MAFGTELRGGPHFVSRSPRAVLLEGIGIIALGLVLAVWPHGSLKLVRVAFGIFALAFAAVQASSALFDKREDKWWRIPLVLLAAAAGIAALVWPEATERVVLVILGLWFLFTGAILLAAGLALPKVIPAKWVVVVCGAAIFIFGLVLVVNPADKSPTEMASVLVVLIGIFAIFEGLLMVLYSFLLRKAFKILEELEEII